MKPIFDLRISNYEVLSVPQRIVDFQLSICVLSDHRI
jgi:hypothetical protein